ncbi:uncharacterized protein LOC122074984 [Macadamia integrifolia]|uniref:uncharacterized protein LOC122074984 n=1 Tax=Macadamia integrifolia TaxID=60698 RepID=UPI001C4FBBC4|nr:uncharacterized protein LOC122074984 [Macadamia integrifolia]
MGDMFIATSLGVSSAGRLWMVTGASNILGSNFTSLARVKVLAGFQMSNPDSSENEPVMLEDANIPGGEKVLEKLQGCVLLAQEEKALAAATEAVKTAMRNLLIKKHYSVDKRKLRKKRINDRKLKQ